jgi:hypothetical protein
MHDLGLGQPGRFYLYGGCRTVKRQEGVPHSL